MHTTNDYVSDVTGGFITLAGERYYAIQNVDKMPPFFISLVSDGDHWMFVSSNGGLTAGRVSPETALFPYITVDKIYESTPHTGCKTLLRIESGGRNHNWEPFNYEHDGRYAVNRNLYKNALGNKLLFEEINHDLQLVFRYSWAFSDAYGFVRQCELENMGAVNCTVEMLDGLQNILPAGTPRFTQTNSSYLVDAYKWNELDQSTGLAFFTLFSAITDRAEPCESLKATTVFSLGLEDPCVLLSSEQLENFRHGAAVVKENHNRGIRGAYLVNASMQLPAGSSRQWQLVANIEQSQSRCADLLRQMEQPAAIAKALGKSITQGSDALAGILAAADGFQLTAQEEVSTHHYANVLFNILRGGIFDNQYLIASSHFRHHLEQFNRGVYDSHKALLDTLPEHIERRALLATIQAQHDPQLERLAYEYLPITFGRRHGDPSRPWNQFAIKLKDDQGNRLLTYQGNWRDIFQNWEALLLSYPEFIENVIAKFVNASTADGYNPYRITNDGIDWEVEEVDDPWSYIGYWGDHQIIYLQKLLELSLQFHPAHLGELLRQPLFSYANVPYKIKPLDALLENAKSTVVYDSILARRIEQKVAEVGADGKLVLNANGQVYQVNLLEKLLVPLLTKLGNLVVDGGIWLNTQRPEWNDANNALVGQGLSMITLYYLRRYITFLLRLLATQPGEVTLSGQVSQWLGETAVALTNLRAELGDKPASDSLRYDSLLELGQAASRYRQHIYQQEYFNGVVVQQVDSITSMLDDALAAIDHSIHSNQRSDGLYHAYNLLEIKPRGLAVDNLYPMLEGQVAVLGSGAITPAQSADLIESLFNSEVFRPDQNTFLLYPDRQLPGFLQKNCVPQQRVEAQPLLATMLDQSDHRIIQRDASGEYRFNADLTNSGELDMRLNELAPVYGEAVEVARQPLRELYEEVFKHKAFTGRSGGMFGFEGLGSIYWHMVSKLLLAAQESFFAARQQGADPTTCQRLASLYYRIRDGIGFNKNPAEYGAFPTDPYSHTPAHIGAQQPGMTGQVKEEILTRFGELGLRVSDGAAQFDPSLLRPCEFIAAPQPFRYLDVMGQWQEITVPACGLAFTWCQVPFLYHLDDSATPAVSVHWDNGDCQSLPALALPAEMAEYIFRRDGKIRKIEIVLTPELLCSE